MELERQLLNLTLLVKLVSTLEVLVSLLALGELFDLLLGYQEFAIDLFAVITEVDLCLVLLSHTFERVLVQRHHEVSFDKVLHLKEPFNHGVHVLSRLSRHTRRVGAVEARGFECDVLEF